MLSVHESVVHVLQSNQDGLHLAAASNGSGSSQKLKFLKRASIKNKVSMMILCRGGVDSSVLLSWDARNIRSQKNN